MNRAQRAKTAPIETDVLNGLLDAMRPEEKQPITARARISEILAETRAMRVQMLLEELEEIGNTAPLRAPVPTVHARPRVPMPKRSREPSKAPFSHIAARLPTTTIPPRMRPRITSTMDLPPAEQKAAQAIADARAKLETFQLAEGSYPLDEPFQDIAPTRVNNAIQTPDAPLYLDEPFSLDDAVPVQIDDGFPELSEQVAKELSGEEISMLPMEIRLKLPEVESSPAAQLTMLGLLSLVVYLFAACVAGFGAGWALA